MSPEHRQAIKQLVDQAVRAKTRPDLDENRCRGCGVEYEDYTVGCRTCIDRRYSRQRYRYKARRDECSGCAGPLDDHTAGCAPCRARHSKRRKRERRLLLEAA